MKQVFFLIIGTAIFISIVGLLGQNQKNLLPDKGVPTITTPQLQKIKIGTAEVEVETVSTKEKRKKGLSGRKSLGKNRGMLFIFQQEQRPAFWMKDMNFAIDIIWINNGKIIQIDENVPPPALNTPDHQLKFYLPNQPVDRVLEVNAGFVKENNIKIGDPVILTQKNQ